MSKVFAILILAIFLTACAPPARYAPVANGTKVLDTQTGQVWVLEGNDLPLKWIPFSEEVPR